MNEKITQLARKYKDLKQAYDTAKEDLEILGKTWGDIEQQLMDAMVDEGVKSINIEGLGTYTMRVTNYLSVNAANKSSFYNYLQESGNGDLLKLDVNPRTLTAFLKGHLEEIERKFAKEGFDVVDSREKALAFLKEKGAAYFTKRDIALKG